MKRLHPKLLYRLRNEILVNDLIQKHLQLPAKHRDGFLRFLCPLCNEFNTATNTNTNLARCFRCNKNFNPIDLVIAVRQLSFLQAVKYLLPLLQLHQQIRAESRQR